MTVENADFISQLNPAWPLGSDDKSEGDNHIRLLKEVLQDQFPNLATSAPVNPTETELNHVVGVTSPIQTQIGSLQTQIAEANPITVGMRFLCRATAGLPNNGRWSLVTDTADRVPMVRNTIIDNASGTWTITGLSAGETGLHTLTASQSGLPPHNHPARDGQQQFNNGEGGSGDYVNNMVNTVTGTNAGQNAQEGHSHPGSLIVSNGTWRPNHQDFVIFQFDG